MGHREDLLDGAEACLLRKGYSGTTARDIVAASGAQLGSIGYHFGSKEALMNAALIRATEKWGDQLEQALTAAADPSVGPREHFEIVWDRIIDLVGHHRALWAAQFEAFSLMQRSPDIRRFLADSQEHARDGLSALLQQFEGKHDPDSAARIGSFHLTLMTGLIAQCLASPEHAPTGHDLAEAIRVMAESIADPGPAV